MNNFSIISLIIFVFAWVLYWEYIYPHIKFKDKTYAQSEKLLKLDLERLDTSSYSAQFIGFSFFVGGLTILDKGTIAIVLILAGIILAIIGIVFNLMRLLHPAKSGVRNDRKRLFILRNESIEFFLE